MKSTLIVLLSFYSVLAISQTIDEKQMEEILLNSIFEELVEKTKGLKPPKELSPEKKSVNKGSRGKQIIEEMKRKNREKIARMRGVNPSEVKSGKDIVQAQKGQNKELISEMNKKIKSVDQWQNLAKEEIQNLKSQMIKDWKLKHAEKIKVWDQENQEFYKNRKKYSDTTFELPLVLNKKDLIEEKSKSVVLDRDYTLVSASLSIPVRDQKYRPTCGSFAGIRAVEGKLFQQNKKWNLSEQYFYWASKEDCQFKKCSRKGSWVGYGLDYSKEKNTLDIPLEDDCAYQAMGKPGNETQIPLGRGCKNGKVKVDSIEYFHSINEVIHKIKSGHIVIASMKLTPNFYTSRSLMLYQDRMLGKSMDNHAAGHSMAIVGFVKLPQVLDEGRVCFIVSNSWGQGWGKGGYSCISEKWMSNQKQVNPFVAVTGVKF